MLVNWDNDYQDYNLDIKLLSSYVPEKGRSYVLR